ncbi:uncharacterized protein ASCRUDRAFT_67517 [Ascoidea rubescens DSM 1968]|uniref:Arrestin-like N-terminal domain-containing protein n=1 Tax=Ascoidea rubescens DSM 1968 TaxID=1344418 RepID=A0A1D2VP75_9ASCO|nr:hypothetical protein ASCRUDRAFT_67517 [Ascoidea rubescens DSM 1968]ODV63410.1 hypothetical protein ASCRUDRAFT_67517 [Ascoidea rubescens DSM 1968]
MRVKKPSFANVSIELDDPIFRYSNNVLSEGRIYTNLEPITGQVNLKLKTRMTINSMSIKLIGMSKISMRKKKDHYQPKMLSVKFLEINKQLSRIQKKVKSGNHIYKFKFDPISYNYDPYDPQQSPNEDAHENESGDELKIDVHGQNSYDFFHSRINSFEYKIYRYDELLDTDIVKVYNSLPLTTAKTYLSNSFGDATLEVYYYLQLTIIRSFYHSNINTSKTFSYLPINKNPLTRLGLRRYRSIFFDDDLIDMNIPDSPSRFRKEDPPISQHRTVNNIYTLPPIVPRTISPITLNNPINIINEVDPLDSTDLVNNPIVGDLSNTLSVKIKNSSEKYFRTNFYLRFNHDPIMIIGETLPFALYFTFRDPPDYYTDQGVHKLLIDELTLDLISCTYLKADDDTTSSFRELIHLIQPEDNQNREPILMNMEDAIRNPIDDLFRLLVPIETYREYVLPKEIPPTFCLRNLCRKYEIKLTARICHYVENNNDPNDFANIRCASTVHLLNDHSSYVSASVSNDVERMMLDPEAYMENHRSRR